METGNTPEWVSPIIWRPGQVRDTKFGTNVPNADDSRKLEYSISRTFR